MRHIDYDAFACSRLLRATGMTPSEIRGAMLRTNGGRFAPSTSSISAWMRRDLRAEGATQYPPRLPTLPTDSIRVWVADALGIPVNTLLRACAGISEPEARTTPCNRCDGTGVSSVGPCGCRSIMTRLLALTTDETPVELYYHPNADDGSGNGWSLMVGDRYTYGTLDKVMS